MTGGGAEARGAAAGWADSAASGCSERIKRWGACAGGVQGRRGGARRGAEWEGCCLRLCVREDFFLGGGGGGGASEIAARRKEYALTSDWRGVKNMKEE